MKRNLNRILSSVLVLVLLAALVVGSVPAGADSVNYVYSSNGKYIYNWGHRDTTATFLSPKAEAFYQKSNITYEDLAALSGSSTTGGGTLASVTRRRVMLCPQIRGACSAISSLSVSPNSASRVSVSSG